jgi:hypothetical protein
MHQTSPILLQFPILNNQLPLAHTPTPVKGKHIPILGHKEENPRHDIIQKKNILGVDDDDYLEHGEGEKNFLDVVMNINHYTSKMKMIAFQLQEHGIQHGEENIFSNGSILFLLHIT